MPNYAKIQLRARDAFKKAGTQFILRQQAESAGYDTTTGSAILPQPADEIRYGLPADQPGNQLAEKFGFVQDPGTLITTNGKWVYMDAVGSRPKNSDEVIISNDKFIVRSSQECNPGGIALFYLVVLET